MQLTIVLPDDVGRRVRQLPDPADFVAQAVRKALEGSAGEAAHPSVGESRWARIVRRVQEDPVHLDGYSEQLKKDIREFRDNFQFNHDG